jgi:hypothetical protein
MATTSVGPNASVVVSIVLSNSDARLLAKRVLVHSFLPVLRPRRSIGSNERQSWPQIPAEQTATPQLLPKQFAHGISSYYYFYGFALLRLGRTWLVVLSI